MKKTDYIGIAFLVLLALLVVFFPINYTLQAKLSMDGCLIHGSFQWTGFTLKGLDQFGNVTRAAPYWMGFLKFALLAMFGEMVKNRLRTGFWHTDLLLVRTVTWGVFGMVMTIAFALFAGGVAGVMGTPLWFGGKDMGEIGNRLIFAISTSFWMNLIFAYPMMLGHEWFNVVFAKRRIVGGTEFLSLIDKHAWGSFIPKTILYFWLPAHFVTFLLPAEYRVLMGAFLSMALGFFLTIRSVKKS